MNLVDTNGYLTWLSQSDGRIKVTDPNVQIWADALANATAAEVRQCTLDHYKSNDTAPTPAQIRRACLALRERSAAMQSALTAKPDLTETAQAKYMSRHLDRPEFQAQMLKGRDVYRAKLRARGITPHAETCPTCQRNPS